MYSKKKYGVFDVIGICFNCSAVSTVLLLLVEVVRGLLPLLNAYATATFIDTAISVFNGVSEWRAAVPPIILLSVTVALDWLILDATIDLSHKRLSMRLRDCIRPVFTEKCARLRYEYIEDNEKWDLITRVTRDPVDRFGGGLTSIKIGLKLIFAISSVMGMVFINLWWAAVIAVLLAIPVVILAKKSGEENYEGTRSAEKEKRLREYLMKTLLSREAEDERAMFSFTGFLNRKYREAFDRSFRITFPIQLKWFFRLKLPVLLYVLISSGISALLLIPTSKGEMSVGAFIAVSAAVFGLVDSMSWDLMMVFEEFAKTKEYMKDVTVFMNLEETPLATEAPLYPPVRISSIEINHLSFAYPGTDREILTDFSMSVKSGEHVSIVGVNGAGKTTLIKLLTGLYDNYKGEILINGKELRKYSQPEIKSIFAIVFQDFARYEISVQNNIDGSLAGRDVDTAMKEAGVDIDKDTVLGRLTDESREISGGQWQRIAIARALASPAGVRILDEPTAALDPIAESDLYRTFRDSSKDTTTIFISHRLGSTRIADAIYVIDAGHVAEKGSHDELMRLGGIYASMFEAQRSWYA